MTEGLCKLMAFLRALKDKKFGECDSRGINIELGRVEGGMNDDGIMVLDLLRTKAALDRIMATGATYMIRGKTLEYQSPLIVDFHDGEVVGAFGEPGGTLIADDVEKGADWAESVVFPVEKVRPQFPSTHSRRCGLCDCETCKTAWLAIEFPENWNVVKEIRDVLDELEKKPSYFLLEHTTIEQVVAAIRAVLKGD